MKDFLKHFVIAIFFFYCIFSIGRIYEQILILDRAEFFFQKGNIELYEMNYLITGEDE